MCENYVSWISGIKGVNPSGSTFCYFFVRGKNSGQEDLNILAFIFHTCNDRHMQNLYYSYKVKQKMFYIYIRRRFSNLKVRFHCSNNCYHKNVVWQKRFTTFTNGSPVQQDLIPPTIFHCDKGIRQILIVLWNGVYPFPELGIKNDYNKKNYDEISLAFLSIKWFVKRIDILAFSWFSAISFYGS